MEGVLMVTHLARAPADNGYYQVETELAIVFSC
jgi:hypothetical protein